MTRGRAVAATVACATGLLAARASGSQSKDRSDQRAYREVYGRYARDLDALDAREIVASGLEFQPTRTAADDFYEIRASGFAGAPVRNRDDGSLRVTR